MHPKRIFAIFYTVGLIALLWMAWHGVPGSWPGMPDAFMEWLQTDHMTHDEKVAEIGRAFSARYDYGRQPTEAEWAAFRAELAAVPSDKK